MSAYKCISFTVMKRFSVWYHIVFWVLYVVVYTIIEASYKNEFQKAFIFELLNLPMRLLIAYFNYLILLPYFLLKNKTFKYFAYTVLSLIVLGFLQRIINYHALTIIYPDMNDFGLWIPYKFLQASTILASPLIYFIGISVIWKVAELQKRAKNLENEKLQSELKYLKSQINPHFLFNTLNNIYGLALEKSKKTPELILKLSDFLSFSLYESNQALISLEKEIALMNDFIALEKSRFEDRVQVKVSISENIGQIFIPPLILVPFVENAFKHSLKDETETATITIKLTITENKLKFSIVNSRPHTSEKSSKKQGLGLVNIKKRLAIIYNENYTLDIMEEERKYTIQLNIDL